MLTSWRQSIKGKLNILTLGVTIGVLLVSSAGLFVAEYIGLRQQKVSDVQILSRTVASNLSAALAFQDKKSSEEILNALQAVPSITRARIQLPSGASFAEYTTEQHAKNHVAEPETPGADRTDERFEWRSNAIEFTSPIHLDGEVIGVLIVSASLADIYARLATFMLITAALMVGASILAYLLTSKLQTLIFGPIVELASLARNVTSDKDYSVRVTQRSNDELGYLVKCFNEMLVQIQLRDAQLTEARAGLEQKVEQRTAELSAEMENRKQAQEALQREQDQLKTLIKHAPVAIAMLDTKLNYIAHSDRWMQDFQLAGLSVIGQNHLATIANMPSAWATAYQDVLKGISFTQPEDELQISDQTTLHLRWTAQPWYRPNGALGGVLKVSIVIDELVEAREAAIRTAKLRTEFLTNVSHELRTPLNAIVGFSRLLMDPTTAKGEQDEYIEVINNSAQLLSNLISDVLDFSKMESKKVKFEKIEFDPQATISRAVDLFRGNAKLKNLNLELKFTTEFPQGVLGDPTRIQQILVNLIGNALKFTERGAITVTARVAESESGRCLVEIDVKDTGIGIAPDKLNLVFEAFTQADGTITRQYGGTGLGLTIVKDLALAMNGDVTVSSVQGEGSTFTVKLALDLPIQPANQPKINLPKLVDRTTPTLRILVAEDNKVNQKLIEVVLKRRGHLVTVVENGVQAINQLQEQSFDIVLMDLQMPEMGGVDACREIRQREANNQTAVRIPVIALTAHAFAEDRARCDEVGMDDYLIKPLDVKKLFECIARVTRAADTGGGRGSTDKHV